MANSLIEWLVEHPPSPERFAQTLATVALTSGAHGDFRVAVREFLDEYGLRPSPLRTDAIAARPVSTGQARHDAYLAALGEHLALRDDLSVPAWTGEPGRFLDNFWFVSPTPGFRAIALARSPVAFRRRGIFITPDALDRR